MLFFGISRVAKIWGTPNHPWNLTISVLKEMMTWSLRCTSLEAMVRLGPGLVMRGRGFDILDVQMGFGTRKCRIPRNCNSSGENDGEPVD